jgi:hypothetical protein
MKPILEGCRSLDKFSLFFLPQALPTISWRPTTVNPIPCQHASSMSSTHRVHTEQQGPLSAWRTFHHDGKISPSWWWWGAHAHPFSLYLPSRTELWFTLQLRGQILYTPPISTLPLYVLCSSSYSTQHSGTQPLIPAGENFIRFIGLKRRELGPTGGGHFTLLTSGSHSSLPVHTPHFRFTSLPDTALAHAKHWASSGKDLGKVSSAKICPC